MKTNKKSLKYAMMILAGAVLFLGVAGSAFCAETYKFERMWPTLQQPWYFEYPQALGVDKEGFIYVGDINYRRIQKFTSNGQFIKKWNCDDAIAGIAIDSNNFVYALTPNCIQKYTSDGQFITQWILLEKSYPYNGIAIDSKDFVYILYPVGSFIQKYTPEGQVIAKWGIKGTSNGELYNPSSIAIDKNNFVFVVDSDGNVGRVQKFTSDGQFVNVWSPCEGNNLFLDANGYMYVVGYNIMKYTSDGQLMAQFERKGGDDSYLSYGKIAVTNGHLYAVDTGNHRVLQYTIDGQYIGKWSSYGEGIGDFRYPAGIALDSKGFVYMVDLYYSSVQKFTPEGQLLDKWGSYGTSPGQINCPVDIVFDRNDYIYIADRNNHRIQKFTPEFQFVSMWGKEGSNDGEFTFPNSIAIDINNNFIYVNDNHNNRIQKFTLDGVFIKKWNVDVGSNSIGIDITGNIYVSNGQDHNIQEYSGEGRLISKWDTYSSGIIYPNKVAVDSSGFVYVASGDLIQKYTSDGLFITQISKKGSDPGYINQPASLCISPSGLVYVSDTYNHRIQVFRKGLPTDKTVKAIVVSAGGPFPGNDIWDATQMSANFAYRTLTYQGFTKETIYYLSSNTQLDLDSNGMSDDVDGDVTKDNLQYAITQWAKDADSVVIYLVDHGGNGIFRLSESQTLSASDLKTWLDTLQAAMPGRVTVIYDACESGSFISKLTPSSGKSRMVITSTSPNEPARFLTQGSVSFSNFFWTHIFNGVNVGDAFDLAVKALASANLQTPMADANDNGIPNESEDFTLARSVYIGNGTKISGNAPVIGSVSPDQTVNNTSSATLTAYNVTDDDGIARVWAVIRPPDYNTGNSGNPVQDLPSVDLMPEGGNLYEAVYDKFNKEGTYRITIYARDRIGNTAIPKLTTVSVTNPLRRRAIIVAGGSQSDPIWTGVQNNALLAYESLKFQGYSDDDIYFMSPVTFSSGVDGSPSLSNLKYAIETWAAVSTQDMVLYMIGNGNVGIFNISPTETLSASVLNNSLEILQGKISGKVTVIYDASNSGSFIKSLISPSGKQRILFSSTGENQTAHFDSDGDISFSKYFWKRVLNGANLRDAFEHARNALNVSRLNQTPYLDDNGNGIGNELGYDGRVARDYKIGFGIMLAGDDPIIGDISPEQTLTGNTSATIWAKVTTTGTIDRVWAMIVPGGNVVKLDYHSSAGRYENSFAFGQYDVVIYAEDKQGNISVPKATSVARIEAAPVTGDINADGVVNLGDAIIALRTLAGIDASAMIRSDYPTSGADVNRDGKIGLQEEIYILQKVAGLR